MSLLPVALTLFIITNPIGNSPAIVALVKDYDFRRQRFILLREGFIALLLALFFQFCGEAFLTLLGLKNYMVSFCGGLLQAIVALSMIFPKPQESAQSIRQEPFIVPIATPLLAGPGLMAIIMLYTQEMTAWSLTASILIAWIPIIFVMGLAPYINKLLGKRGLVVLEQIMGMFLLMIAIGMMVKGASLFVTNVLKPTS